MTLVAQPDEAHKYREEESLREEILSFARQALSPYNVPKIIELMDKLPLTPVGKVESKALRGVKPLTRKRPEGFKITQSICVLSCDQLTF